MPMKTNQQADKKEEKLSVAACKKILNENGNNYTDEEVLKIRDYLYKLAEIQCRHFKDWQEKQESKIVHLNSNHYETTKSYPLYQGKYRRTG